MMSGRTRWKRDGHTVVGYRKTDRRQTKRPAFERLAALNLKGLDTTDSKAVRMAFLLPASLQGLVSSGVHGVGVMVLARGFVRISGHSSEQCFALARDFFHDVARDRPGFTVTAAIASSAEPSRSYGRHLTVVAGAMVVSAGWLEPKVFEARR